MKIEFTHNMKIGVSFGFYNHNGNIIMSAAFCKPCDRPSRAMARKIIEQRIRSFISNQDSRHSRYVHVMPLDTIGNSTDARKTVKQFRHWFLPDENKIAKAYHSNDELWSDARNAALNAALGVIA